MTRADHMAEISAIVRATMLEYAARGLHIADAKVHINQELSIFAVAELLPEAVIRDTSLLDEDGYIQVAPLPENFNVMVTKKAVPDDMKKLFT
ncbi:hypothetical protein EC973_005567 [Apophysomyces ossiformis]|uniref:Uncharacterized protein n=1 Tax=Apophysomyces ossiformis TaxID=679940 RepID=A0A8H7BW98_9FUNG|nr:hypothetical protein EC973_005567 [Apophysomyces ossiformis]